MALTANSLRAAQSQSVESVDTFTWDWATSVPEMLYDGQYTYLVGHDTLGWEGARTPMGPLGWTYVLPDALGSVRQETDANGNVTAVREWSPYGEEVGGAQAGLGYTGEWFDANVGLTYLRARWYDGSTGRFITEDPLSFIEQPQTLNLYAYVLNRPLFLVDPSGWQGIPFDPNNWIAGVIRSKRHIISSAANRHNLLPAFLGAVLYLENSNATESAMQDWVGDTPQQAFKFLWNVYVDGSTTQPDAFITDLPKVGPKEWAYFKFGRSQGIGAIKPEVAMYLHSREMVYNPYTGEPLDYYYAEDTVILPVSIQTPESGFLIPICGCKVEGMEQLYLFGIHNRPFERVAMMARLGNQDWSIEYLAAHLDAARVPQHSGDMWPAHVSRTDNKSEDALRLMVTYHYNTNNLIGWDKPSHAAYQAGTQVIEWMPWISLLLTPISTVDTQI